MLQRRFCIRLALLIFLFHSVSFSQPLSWLQTNGPYGGRVQSFAESPDGSIYVLGGGSVSYTTDKGTSWIPTSMARSDIYQGCIAVNSHGIVFASDAHALYRSSDKGTIWNECNFSSSQINIVATNRKGHIYVAAGNSIFISTDDGITWNSEINISSVSQILDLTLTQDNNYFAATDQGLYRSTDNGFSWFSENSDLWQTSINSVLMTKTGKLFIGTKGKVSSSTDFGLTWKDCLMTYWDYPVKWIIADSSGTVWASNSADVYSSSDNGTNWKRILYKGGLYNWQTRMHAAKDGTLYAATMKGVLISKDNTGTWELSDKGIIATDNRSILITKEGTFYCTNDVDIFSSNDFGNEWKKTGANKLSGADFTNVMFEDKNGIIYGGAWESFNFSTDHGMTWSKTKLAQNNSSYPMGFVNGTDGKVYMATQHAFFSISDSGRSWKKLYNWPITSGQCILTVNRKGEFLAALANGVYRSSDFGCTWEKITPSFNETDFISLHISRKGLIFTGFNTGGYIVSADDGRTWERSSSIVSSYSADDIFEDASGRIYFQNFICLFYSDDDGASWTKLDDIYQRNFTINKIAIDKKGYMFAASRGRGVFRSKDPVLKILPPFGVKGCPGNQKAVLSWNKNSSANFKHYRIYGGNYHYPAALLKLMMNGPNDTSITFNGLENNKTYYYVVSAVDNQGNESFSDEISVTPLPSPHVPKLVSCLNNAVNTSFDKLILKWNKSLYADTYHLRLSCDSLFSSIVLDDSSLLDTVKILTNLKYSTKYFWKIKAMGPGGESQWSEKWSFTTIIAAPEKPLASVPNNNAVNLKPKQVFVWNKCERAEHYHFQLSKDQDFTNCLENDSLVTDTLRSCDLANGTKYFWRIRAFNIGGTSPWSDIMSFTTIPAVPAAPAALSPADGSKDQSVSLKLTWNPAANAETYRLTITSEGAKVLEDSAITNTFRDITGLKTGVKYTWQVSAKNIAGESTQSSAWSFVTILPSPADLNLEALGPKNVKLTWKDKSDNESGFVIERCRDKESVFKAIDTMKANVVTYTDSTVSFSTTYKYRVSAFTPFAISGFTNAAYITILTSVSGVQPGIPSEYALMQNCPNPFNPSTSISYSIPKDSYVELKVYNILGSELSTLVNKEQNAGEYKVRFDGSSLPSGIYIYSIHAGDYRATRKLMLLK